MTQYDLDLSTSIQTEKFHSNFGFALSRYAILVHGNGNRVLYHFDGADKVDSMIDFLYNQKVISKSLDWFQGNNENKLKSLAWLDGVNVAIVDNNKLLNGEDDYVIVDNEEIRGAIDRYVYKVKHYEY